MSTSNSNSAKNTPRVVHRRTLLACTNCRKRKIRCFSPEKPLKSPCTRCSQKGLICEYVTVEQETDPMANQPSHLQPSPGLQAIPAMPSWAAQPVSSASFGFPAGRGMTPPLPYTAPPPPLSIPRYSGTAYPDLSLATPKAPCPHHTHSEASNPMPNQGYQYTPQASQAYPYMGGLSAVQPNVYPSENNGHPSYREQIPYDGVAPTPKYAVSGWPADQGSRRD
ncbi:hypothetical protein DFH08DRAFT_945527 [Mycena albidolilacea]|uniref:Zn(2)-C6 fungal-type domain-containing protein n=1 Tax=Mycena albidolilacea TaxID=1033008 RepID=A0AAD6Z1B0_9AGAR|nr:hypothetical protein DFH08DRAFT_945527 [Mycena albidolilacea]